MKQQEINVELTITEGYQTRFTEACLRQYENHVRENDEKISEQESA